MQEDIVTVKRGDTVRDAAQQLAQGGYHCLPVLEGDRLVGMVLYAPALNYAYPYYQYHRDQLSEETRNRLDQGDIHVLSHTFGDAMLKKDFAEDSLKYEIDLQREVEIGCPVRIIHGLEDKEVRKFNVNLVSSDLEIEQRRISFGPSPNLYLANAHNFVSPILL